MKEYPRIVFMGTPEIAGKILQGLIDSDYHVVGVVAQEDKPQGRKGIITPPVTKKIAAEHGIPVAQPHRIRTDYAFLYDMKPDLIITCAYGQIVPHEVLAVPSLGSINIHGSLLPKYRGASPIQQTLIHGDKTGGVTIMEMVDEMDAGDMYAKKEIPLEENDNYTSLYDKVGTAGLELLLEMLPQFVSDRSEGKKIGEAQNPEEVTFCGKIKKEQEHLSLDYTCDEFVSWVRGLSYTPGGYLLYEGQVFKILKAAKANDRVSSPVGTIVSADKKGILMQLKDGQVSLLEVQKQGKSRMDYRSYLNGDRNMQGKVLA